MMLRASFIGILAIIGLTLVLGIPGGWSIVPMAHLAPALMGGLIAGYVTNRGFPGGLGAGGLMALLMFLWTLAIATGWGVPPMYEQLGQFPGVGAVALSVAPAALSAVAGGIIGGLVRELRRWAQHMGRSRAAAVQSRYYEGRATESVGAHSRAPLRIFTP